jgi:hypothetical protein
MQGGRGSRPFLPAPSFPPTRRLALGYWCEDAEGRFVLARPYRGESALRVYFSRRWRVWQQTLAAPRQGWRDAVGKHQVMYAAVGCVNGRGIERRHGSSTVTISGCGLAGSAFRADGCGAD